MLFAKKPETIVTGITFLSNLIGFYGTVLRNTYGTLTLPGEYSPKLAKFGDKREYLCTAASQLQYLTQPHFPPLLLISVN